MIANPDHRPMMTPQQYLEWEFVQPLRYEYIDGEVVAMTGGTIPHNQVSVNFVALLKAHLRGKGCKILSGDAKIAVSEDGPFYYADVSVACDQRDRSAYAYIRYPCLITEVLSPSTEAFDRGQKFRHYRQIETLREYLLIDPEHMSLEYYRLNKQGHWELFEYSDTHVTYQDPEYHVVLESVNLSFPISLLYEDIDLPSRLENGSN